MLVRLIWCPEVTSNTSFIRTLLYVIFLKFLIHENVHFLFKLLLRAIWLPNPEDHISSLSLGIVRSGKSSGLDDQKAIVELIRFGMANLNNKHELVRDVRRTPKALLSIFLYFTSLLHQQNKMTYITPALTTDAICRHDTNTILSRMIYLVIMYLFVQN